MFRLSTQECYGGIYRFSYSENLLKKKKYRIGIGAPKMVFGCGRATDGVRGSGFRPHLHNSLLQLKGLILLVCVPTLQGDAQGGSEDKPHTETVNSEQMNGL